MKKQKNIVEDGIKETAKRVSSTGKKPVDDIPAICDDDENIGTEINDIKTATGLMYMIYLDTTDYDFSKILEYLQDIAEKGKHTYAWIMHDKDRYKQNTFNTNHELVGKKGDLKKRHIHFLLLFKNGENKTISQYIPNGFPRRFVQIVKPSKHEIATLYLSHIAHPDKHQYNYKNITTNNRGWVDGVHENYTPYMIVDFIEKYLDNPENERYIKYTEIYRYVRDTLKGSYGYYKQNYSVIRDMINDHNKWVKDQMTETNQNDRVDTKARIKNFKDDEAITKLVDSFGCTTVEINGQLYTISKTNK